MVRQQVVRGASHPHGDALAAQGIVPGHHPGAGVLFVVVAHVYDSSIGVAALRPLAVGIVLGC